MAKNNDLVTMAALGIGIWFAYKQGWLRSIASALDPDRHSDTDCPNGYVYDSSSGMCIFPIPTDGSHSCAYPAVPAAGTSGLVWNQSRCCWQDHNGTCRYDVQGQPVNTCPSGQVPNPFGGGCMPIPTGGDGTCGNPTTPAGGPGGLTWAPMQCCWIDSAGRCMYGPHGYLVAQGPATSGVVMPNFDSYGWGGI